MTQVSKFGHIGFAVGSVVSRMDGFLGSPIVNNFLDLLAVDARTYGLDEGNSGAENTSALQAMASAISSSGRPAKLPPGTFDIAGKITFTDLFVRGSGIGRTVFRKTTDNVAFLIVGGEFMDVTVQGSDDGTVGGIVGDADNVRAKGGSTRVRLTRIESDLGGATAIRLYDGNAATLRDVVARRSNQHGIAFTGTSDTNSTEASGLDIRGNADCGVFLQNSDAGNGRSRLAGTIQNNNGAGVACGSRDNQLNLYVETDVGAGRLQYTVGSIAGGSSSGTISTNISMPEQLEYYITSDYDGNNVVIEGTDLDGGTLTETVVIPSNLPAIVQGTETFEAGSLVSITSAGGGTSGTVTARVGGYYEAGSIDDTDYVGTLTTSPVNNGVDYARETVYSIAFDGTFDAGGVRVCGLDREGLAVVVSVATATSTRVRAQAPTGALAANVRRLDFASGGYTGCVNSDITKTVTDGTSSGTLLAFNNTLRTWYVSGATAADVFDQAASVTITSGTGAGTTNGAAALNSLDAKFVTVEATATYTIGSAGGTATIYADRYRHHSCEMLQLGRGNGGFGKAEYQAHIYRDGDGVNEAYDSFNRFEEKAQTAGTRINTFLATAALFVRNARFSYTGYLMVKQAADLLYDVIAGGSTSQHTLRMRSEDSDTTKFVLDVLGRVRMDGTDIKTPVVAEVTITSSQDNWQPCSNWDVVDAIIVDNTTGDVLDVTGLLQSTVRTKVKRIQLANGSGPVRFVHNLTSSAANRLMIPGGRPVTYYSGESFTAWYDPFTATLGRWRVQGKAQGPARFHDVDAAGATGARTILTIDGTQFGTNWSAAVKVFYTWGDGADSWSGSAQLLSHVRRTTSTDLEVTDGTAEILNDSASGGVTGVALLISGTDILVRATIGDANVVNVHAFADLYLSINS